MIIYPDSTVLTSMELYAPLRRKVLASALANKYRFAYSPVHILDTYSFTPTGRLKKNKVVFDRLDLINKISDGLLVTEDQEGILQLTHKSPFAMYERAPAIADSFTRQNEILQSLVIPGKDSFQKVQLDDTILKELTAVEVLAYLEEKFAAAAMGYDFSGLLQHVAGKQPTPKSMPLSICYLLYLLEELQYGKWEEMEPVEKTPAWESYHVIMGSRADVFLSDDEKIIKRATLAYYLHNIPTKVMSIETLLGE